MKHYYTFLQVAAFLVATCIPPEIIAQCDCEDGTPATPVSYTVRMDSSTLDKVIISFPKFDPSIGTLSCIVLKDTTSGVSATHVRNLAPQDIRYRFRLTVSTSITGPGFGISEAYDQYYGPDTLRTYETPGDSITYGPDTMFNSATHTTVNNSNLTPYMGTGTVDLEFEIGGGLTSLQGGLNFNNQIRTYTWGVFNLTYYWCPASILARSITRFTAIKKDNQVLLNWEVNNEEAANTYEILISYDGRHFVRLGQAASQYITAGATAKYQYQYLLNQAVAGKLYFRIRQKDAAGHVSYSPIRVVNPDEQGPASVVIYPNPVKRSITLQFDKVLNSRFAIEVISAGGQLLQQQEVKAHNTPLIQFDLTRPVPPGVYYLRARDLGTHQQYLHKLLVQ
jgi:hypothetical protein